MGRHRYAQPRTSGGRRSEVKEEGRPKGAPGDMSAVGHPLALAPRHTTNCQPLPLLIALKFSAPPGTITFIQTNVDPMRTCSQSSQPPCQLNGIPVPDCRTVGTPALRHWPSVFEI